MRSHVLLHFVRIGVRGSAPSCNFSSLCIFCIFFSFLLLFFLFVMIKARRRWVFGLGSIGHGIKGPGELVSLFKFYYFP